MRTNALSLVLSLVALVLGGAGLLVALSRSAPSGLPPSGAARTGAAAPADGSDLRGEINGLKAEVARLRSRVEAERPSAAPAPAPAAGPGDATEKKETAEALNAELERLRDAVLSGKADAKETARFWKLARTSPWLDSLLARLEKAVTDSPEDVAARMNLANACVAKLYTVPNGPERGAWASRAEKQWREVLDRDPRNERARMSLAISLSQWPDFFGKAPEAIRQLETLKKQQEEASPEAGQAATWLHLAELYLRQGRHDDGVATLKDGLRRFPENTALKEALQAAGK